MPALYSLSSFLEHIARELELDDVPDEGQTVWDAGIDSALIIDLVIAVEDLGVDIADAVDWSRATFGDIYSAYAVVRAAPRVPGND